ncbi:MAG: hypothetical protein C0596_04260 [Marinilabiliales bacterium]|nr:MAG: hypothetical protein C0596_04260 [Marinilabiliales bacterium]
MAGDFQNGNGGIIFGNGEIHVDGNFTGPGSTFGLPNESIPAGSTISEGSLPVELIYFKSYCENSIITLEWETASETNNDYFTIEKSYDGINYYILEIIYGAGNTSESSNYKYNDIDNNNGYIYYRLKQTDFDGKTEILGTVVNNTQNNNSILEAQYSNPISPDDFQIMIYGKGDITIQLFSTNGQVLYKNIITCLGENYRLRIPNLNIKSGIYFIRISNDLNENCTYKLIIQA